MKVTYISSPATQRFAPLTFFLAVLLFGNITVWAASPGDSCSNNGGMQRENAQTLICDGSTWNLATELETDGRVKLRINEEADPCDNSIIGQLRFEPEVGTIDYCNGSDWVPIPKILTHLSDVNISNPGNGTLLGWDSGSGEWVAICSNLPDDFNFIDVSGVNLGNRLQSNVQPITGSSCSSSISISGDGSPQFRVCSDPQCGSVIKNWRSSASTIDAGQYVQISLLASSENLTVRTATLTIGSVSRSWSVTTNNPGSYKRVFVVNNEFKGDMGGLAGADQICQDRAVANSYAGTFYAWLATDSSDDPESRFTRASVEYRDPIGQVVAYDWASLTSGGLAKYFDMREDVLEDTGWDKWTNVAADGTAKYNGTNNCLGWTSSSNAQMGHVGRSNTSGESWTDHDLMPCDSDNIRLICIQQ